MMKRMIHLTAMISMLLAAMALMPACATLPDTEQDFGYEDIGHIMDVYNRSVNELEAGDRVMILFLDGFSWQEYQKAMDEDTAPYIEAHFTGGPALSVMKPVTNSGMAAMITGTPPEVNGIADRSKREYRVPDIFDKAAELGKKAALIEGDIQILKTSLAPVLNVDRDDDGTDDEVVESALNALAEAPDLIMVHFHGIDDQGHAHGPYSKEVTDKINEIDGYIKLLAAEFNGTILLVADHGMHEDGSGGDHGENLEEDMVVPFLTMESEGR